MLCCFGDQLSGNHAVNQGHYLNPLLTKFLYGLFRIFTGRLSTIEFLQGDTLRWMLVTRRSFHSAASLRYRTDTAGRERQPFTSAVFSFRSYSAHNLRRLSGEIRPFISRFSQGKQIRQPITCKPVGNLCPQRIHASSCIIPPPSSENSMPGSGE